MRPLWIGLPLFAILIVACSSGDDSPTPNIEATVRSAVLTALPTPTAIPRPQAPGPPLISGGVLLLTPALVVRVIDGDTIDVAIDGLVDRVRYIGIDAPETVHPTIGEEPFGKEASARNRALVEGRIVSLEKDVSETDQYGRLLRYVWLDEQTMVSAVLVAEGLAQVTTYPPDVKYAEAFLDLQRVARARNLGLWGAAQATATPRTGIVATTQSRSRCDPAYPDVCIPPPPPDLDCGEIPFRRFRVLRPDPHGFDRDLDGIGCES